jgi:hypothetical protein
MMKFWIGLILGASLAVASADDLHGIIPQPVDAYLNTASHGRFANEILAIKVDKDGYVICSKTK